MSKERLEEIKIVENWDNLNEWQFKQVAWLIGQTERAIGLEKRLQGSRTLYGIRLDKYVEIEQQNKRYRDAFQDILVVLDWKTDNTSRLVKRLINKALEADK